MTPRIARPGRALALLEGISVGVPVLYLLAQRVAPTEHAHPIAMLVGHLAIVAGPIAVVLWARGEADGLLECARERGRWVPPVVLGLLFATGALSWSEWQGPVAGLAVLGALVGAAWYLHLAWRASRWVHGRLAIGTEVRLVAPGTTYVLGRAPVGSEDGDHLTIPEVQVDEPDAGPYRTGRPIGWAPEVLPIPRRALTSRLVMRGVALGFWAIVCIASVL